MSNQLRDWVTKVDPINGKIIYFKDLGDIRCISAFSNGNAIIAGTAEKGVLVTQNDFETTTPILHITRDKN